MNEQVKKEIGSIPGNADVYLAKEEVRHMSQGTYMPEDHEEVIELMKEANRLSTDEHATPMSLERARSINLELARVFLYWAGNLEHVIWEFGGHRAARKKI